MAVFDVNLAILALKTTIFWPKNGCFRTRKRVIGTGTEVNPKSWTGHGAYIGNALELLENGTLSRPW